MSDDDTDRVARIAMAIQMTTAATIGTTEELHAHFLHILNERKQLRAELASVRAERDAAYENAQSAQDECRNVRHNASLLAGENSDLEDKLSSACASVARLEAEIAELYQRMHHINDANDEQCKDEATVERETAEAIAAWLESTVVGLQASARKVVADDIRDGKWRP